MKDFSNGNLPDAPATPPYEDDWISSGNVVRTDKNLNIKNRFVVNDIENVVRMGRIIKRTAFSTLVYGSLYSVATNDYLIGVTSLSYAPTIGLPRPKLVGEGKIYVIKDEVGGAATTTITIRSAGEETIDGAMTATLTTNYELKEFYSDGANWLIK